MSQETNPTSEQPENPPKYSAAVTFSDEAVAAAVDLQNSTPAYADLPLRVYIDGKGCDGFYYGVTFDNPDPDDLVIRQSVISIVVDQETLKYVKGSIVTWVDDDRGKGFLVNNPNHRKFKGKFFRRENWQHRLT
jgi:iron-sulfur cluster assembly accessory protein